MLGLIREVEQAAGRDLPYGGGSGLVPATGQWTTTVQVLSDRVKQTYVLGLSLSSSTLVLVVDSPSGWASL